jgi:hypothetical protein
MTKIYVYCLYCEVADRYIGLAITETGKWIAGSVSRRNEETAIERTAGMAQLKAEYLLSDVAEIVHTTPEDPRVLAAQEIAFQRMP